MSAGIQQNILFLKTLEKRLSGGDVLSPVVEAEDLISYFGRLNRVDFFTGTKTLTSQQKKKIDQALRVRLKGTPLSHILKERRFLGRDFFISPDTLIPRPETEILVEETLKLIDKHYLSRGTAPEVLDIGTGSGCIAVSLTSERPDCRMTALDISAKALRVARKNIYSHGLQKKIKLVKSDLFSVFRGKQRRWDIVVSNPPYVPKEELSGLSGEVRKEPRLALDGGMGGTKVIYSLLEEAPVFLKENGWLLLEIGAGQSEILRKKVLGDKNFKNLSFAKDLTGIERVLIVQKKSNG